MNIMIFDIETTCDKQGSILFMPQFKAPSNYKDTDKIESYIQKETSEWFEGTPLNPLTGEVCAIGYSFYYGKDVPPITNIDLTVPLIGEITEEHNRDEAQILQLFWKRMKDHNGLIIGHNIKQFDLPFLYLRSLKHNITPCWSYWKRNDFSIFDLAELWNSGRRQPQFISLNHLAKFFNVGEKQLKGDKFYDLARSPNTRQDAIDYLLNDLKLTYEVFQKFKIWQD